MSSTRIIGIRHRIKKTAKGEARPSEVAIFEQGAKKPTVLKLADETAELDFIKGIYPVEYREAAQGEDLISIPEHHRIYYKADEIVTRIRSSEDYDKIMVPSVYEGLRSGDRVGMILGGSGNYLAYAMARQGMKIGAMVFRLPAYQLKAYREEKLGQKVAKRANRQTPPSAPAVVKDEDSRLLAELLRDHQELFLIVDVPALNMIDVTELFRARMDAMKDRIACEQRLRQRAIGMIFCPPDGLFPEGSVEKAYDRLKANDVVFKALFSEEKDLIRKLETALDKVSVYTEILSKVEGIGPLTSARIISTVSSIQSFSKDSKLKKFLGVHVMDDGRFPRQRRGERGEFNPTGRQAMYLIAESFLKKPDSKWGKVLREYWEKFQLKHPDVLSINTDFKPLFHSIQRRFIKHKIPHNPPMTDLKTVGDLTLYVATAQAQVKDENGMMSEAHEQLFSEISKEMAELNVTSTKTSKSYNPGHLLQSAKWRTLTKFTEWLFKEWKALEAKSKDVPQSEELKEAA